MEEYQPIILPSNGNAGEISEDKSVIKVIGVGGGGTNAANHMFELGINNVDFIVCNTDNQSLLHSPIPVKIQLGPEGHGAGNDPEKGRIAADYSLGKIKELLEDSTKMVFVTAGMGGGTGTGAAPLIAKTAKDMGILTVGIVTIPFKFEGKRRITQALKGVEAMRESVDSILVISTERIAKIYSDFTLEKAFACADDILATAAKGIAEIITLPGYINVDLEDVKTVMTNSGSAVMGAAKASGKDRALTAIQNSLDSPLLLSTNLQGAKDILLNIAYGEDGILVDELTTITEYLQSEVQCDENQIIWGATKDSKLAANELNITIVATGFSNEEIDKSILGAPAPRRAEPTRITLTAQEPVQEPVQQPMGAPTWSNPRTTTNEGNALYDQYYGGETKKGGVSVHSNVTPVTDTLPTSPLSFNDEDEDKPISNFGGSFDVSPRLSFNDSDDVVDDRNGFLSNNVD